MILVNGEWQARRVSGGGWAIPRNDAATTAAAASPEARRLRVVVADADALARRQLRQLLDQQAGLTVISECDGGDDLLDVVVRERPELVFLDPGVPDGDGFALAGELRPYVRGGLIIVADRAECALRSFDVHALDFVLKPVARERLAAAVAYARSMVAQERRGPETLQRLVAALDRRDAERQRRARLLIRHADGAFFVKTDAIDWVEAAGKLVKVHAGKQVYVQREALARIERHLDPDQFVRISRSAIVNIDRIRALQPWFNGEYLVLLDDTSQVLTSRHYRVNLRRLLGKGDEP